MNSINSNILRNFLLSLIWLLADFTYAQSAVPAEVVSVASAGYWQSDGRSGQHRVVLVYEGWEHVTTRMYVEWVAEPKSRNEEPEVVATIEPPLPFGQNTASFQVSLRRVRVGCTEISLSGVISTMPSQKVAAKLFATEPGRVHLKKSKGSCY